MAKVTRPPVLCKNPTCGEWVQQKKAGAPRLFCDNKNRCWKEYRATQMPMCSFCGKRPVYIYAVSKGFCRVHWYRDRNGLTMSGEPRAQYTPGSPRPLCSHESGCLIEVWASGLCNRHGRQKWASDNPERDRLVKRRAALKKYHLSVEEYEALVVAQGGLCANTGCGVDVPGGKGEWHIDHDHRCCPGTGSCGLCIRGLLCHNCNLLIGHAQDDPLVLDGAALYLRGAVTPIRVSRIARVGTSRA